MISKYVCVLYHEALTRLEYLVSQFAPVLFKRLFLSYTEADMSAAFTSSWPIRRTHVVRSLPVEAAR